LKETWDKVESIVVDLLEMLSDEEFFQRKEKEEEEETQVFA
jgi:hypothetical protein